MSKWKWIKKNWKTLLKIIIFFGTIITGALMILKTREGKISKQVNFVADGKDDTIIHINDGEKFIPVKLPLDTEGKQIKAKDVEAAGYSAENILVIEAKHEKVNRRNISSIDNNALDSLGLSGRDNNDS